MMARFELEEVVVVKVRGETRSRGKINHIFERVMGTRLYGVTLEEPDINSLLNIFALDNKHCCKYGFGRESYQVYKLRE